MAGVDHLAIRKKNNQLWTGKDALLHFLEEIEKEGLHIEQLVCHYLVAKKDDPTKLKHGYVAAGVTYEQHLFLLEKGKIDLMNEAWGDE